jgi:serine/threonine-protein kinase
LSSDSATRITLALVERFLREHGLDESRASVVHDVLTSSQIITSRDTERRPATPSGPPTLAETRSSGVPTMAGVAQTVLAVPSPVMSDASGSFRPPAARLVPGAVIGTGGMGEVCRVEDASLRRTLAMKILLADLADEPALRERFVAEAQVTAQLAHPNIPPVHEIGELSDGRPYFTMKEVRGVTLAQVLDEAHRDPLGATRWSEQRRLELFQKVCAAVAYAHARGVAHCDLKPANVMVGAFGEVQVMDWGVARLVGASGTTSSDEPPVSLEGLAAVQSIVAGTPAYMAPEQALGLGELIGPASDVYALGVMLFEVLAGERPYRGTARELVQQAQSGPVPPLPRRPASVADDALYAIITRAMAADPAERFADAKAMDAELSRWREGAMRREKAAAIVAQARTMAVTIEPTFARAAELREQAIAALDRLDPEAPVEAKEPIWTVLDEASERARTATLRQVQAEQLLVQALGQSPELDEAHRFDARLA